MAQALETAAQFGVSIDLQSGRWRTADGRAGTTEPFAVDGDEAKATPPPQQQAAPTAAAAKELTAEQVHTVVNHVVQLSRSSDPAAVTQVTALLQEAQKNFGLEINLAQRRWRLADGRSGSTEPFSVSKEENGNGTTAAAMANGGAGGAKSSLTDQALHSAVAHLVHLQRSGQAAEMSKNLEIAAKLGVNIDLNAGRWSTADGRTGTTDPFAIDKTDETKPAAAAKPKEETPGAKLTAAHVSNVVTTVVQMAADPSKIEQARALLEEAQKNVGLEINLQQRRWRLADGRSGGTEPFSVDPEGGNGGSGANGAPKEPPGKECTLSDEQLAKAVSHVVQLQRAGQTAQVPQTIDGLAKLGLKIDLASKSWATTDGMRMGATEPFAIEKKGKEEIAVRAYRCHVGQARLANERGR